MDLLPSLRARLRLILDHGIASFILADKEEEIPILEAMLDRVMAEIERKENGP